MPTLIQTRRQDRQTRTLTALFRSSRRWLLLPLAGLWLAAVHRTSAQTPPPFTADNRFHPTGVYVTFEQGVDPATVVAPNFTVAGLAVLALQLQADGRTVLLTTASQVEGQTYALTVQGVKYVGGGAVSPNPVVRNWTHGAGVRIHRITHDRWDGLPGTSTDILTKLPAYPNHPSVREALPRFEIPVNARDNYGGRIYGLFNPPASGSYLFYVSSDDQSQLFLSTDANPANKTQVAREPSWNGSREYVAGANQGSRGVPPANVSAPVNLTAGQPVWLELIYKEGDGGDNASVTARFANGPAIINGSLPLAEDQFAARHREGPDGSQFINYGPAQITQTPTGASVVEGTVVVLGAVGDGSPPHRWIWHRNGQIIPGAVASTYSFTALPGTEGSYTVTLANDFSEVTSDPAVVQVAFDNTPPTVVSARGTEGRNRVRIRFSEAVDPASATALANYALAEPGGALPITAAELLGPDFVELQTGKQPEGVPLTLTLNNIKDRSLPGNLIAPNTVVRFDAMIFLEGIVLNRRWEGISTLAGLTNDPGYPDRPDSLTLEPLPEYPANGGNEAGASYGNLLTFWWTPEATGDYEFFVNADDQAELWLSTDDDPANKKRIAIEPQWNNPRQWVSTERRNAAAPENRSTTYQGSQWPGGPGPIRLVAGQRYFVEAVHAEGSGGDNVGVNVRLLTAASQLRQEEDSPEAVQNGEPPRFTLHRIAHSVDPQEISLSLLKPPQDVTVKEGETAIFDAEANAVLNFPPLDWRESLRSQIEWEWQATAPGDTSGIFLPLPGATGPNLNLENVTLADDGRRIRVVVTCADKQVVSPAVLLHVVPDRDAPQIYRIVVDGEVLQLHFDEKIDPGSVIIRNFTLTTQAGEPVNILSVNPSPDGTSVTMEVPGGVVDSGRWFCVKHVLCDPRGNCGDGELSDCFQPGNRSFEDFTANQDPPYRFTFNSSAPALTFPNSGSDPNSFLVHLGPNGPAGHQVEVGPRPPAYGGLSPENRAAFLTRNTWFESAGPPLNLGQEWTLMASVRLAMLAPPEQLFSITSQRGAFALAVLTQQSPQEALIQLELPDQRVLVAPYPHDGNWHLVAVVAKDGTFDLHVDGRRVATMNNAGFAGSDSPWIIGGGTAEFGASVDSWGWNGGIDEVLVYLNALDPDEIQSSSDIWRFGDVPPLPEFEETPGQSVSEGSRPSVTFLWDSNWTTVGMMDLKVDGGAGLTSTDEFPKHIDFSQPGLVGFNAATPGEYKVQFSLGDGVNVVHGEFQVTVTDVNQNPVARDDAFSTPEDQVLTGNLFADNGSGPDGDEDEDPLRISNPGTQSTAHGQFIVEEDGTFRYVPQLDFFGQDLYIYAVSDGQGGSATATATITVTPRNDKPQFTPGPHLQFRQDGGPVVLQGWASDVRAGPPNEAGQAVTFRVLADPSSLFSEGPAIAGNGDLSLTPAPGAFGRATVTVQAFDNGGVEDGGSNASAIQSFTIDVQRLTAELALSVATTTPELSGDVPGVVSLAVQNRGPETAGRVRLVVESEHGVTLTCPDGATCQSDSPHILSVDLGTLAPDATATIEIPVRADGSEEGPIRVWGHVATTSGDTALNNNQGSVLLNVIGQTAPMREGVQVSQLTFDLVDDPDDDREGGVTLHSEWGLARIRYVPTKDVMYFSAVANGQLVADNLPLLHLGAPGDDQPVKKEFSFRIRENPGEPTVTIEWDYRITDDPSLAWVPAPKPTKVAPRQVCIRAGLIGASLLYQRPPGFDPEAIDVLVDYAAHEKGFPNQPQGAVECAPAAISNSLNYLNSRFDLGLDPDALTLEKMKAATHWSLEKEGAPPKGTRDMEAGWWRDHKAKYMEDQKLGIITEDTTDPQKALEALRKGYDVEVELFGHVAALVGMGRFKNGRYVLEMAHDLYQDGLESGAQVVEGGVLLDPPTGQVRGSVWQNGLASFIIERPANVRPRLPGESVTTPEDTPVSGDLRATDHENDPLTFRIVTDPQHGRVILDDTGRWTYTPDPNFSGTDSFAVVADDGKTVSRPGTVTLEIAAVNDPPIAQPDRVTLLEDHDVSGNVIHNEIGPDSDPDGDPLTAARVLVKEPENGSGGVVPNGDFGYSPRLDFFGIDSFTYTVHDGKGGTATAKVTFTVTPVNDEPFFVKGGDQTVNSELPLQTIQAWATSILPGPANEAGQNVEFLVTTDRPDLFAVAPWVSPGGTLTYQPSPGANGVATVTVRAKDDGGTANDGRDTSEPQTFTITVRPDAPIRLTINLTPDNTPRIHWVDPEDRLHLEVTPSLSPESWTPVLEGVEQQGTDRFFQIPGGEEGGYWRLQITEPLAPDPQSAAETLIQKLDLEPGARVLIRGPVPPETTVVENSGEMPRPEVLRIPSREGDYYIVIADPTPGLKHGHPMKYGWIDLDTQETGQASGEWPADILVPNEEPQPYHLTDSTVIEQAEVRLVTGSGAGTVRTPAGPEDAAVHLPGAGCKKIALVVDGGDKEAEERHLANIMALDADRFAEWLEDNQFTVSRRSQARRHPSPHFSSGGFGPALNLLARIEQIGATEFSCDPDPGCCHEFFLYVGSHGSRSRLSFYDASGSGQVSFLYYDELFAALAKFPPCVKIVVFVDSCYAGVAQNFLPLLCAGRPCGATIVTAVDVSWSAPGGLPFETDSATQDFLEPKARFDGDGDGKVGDFRDRWMHMKSERESVVPLPATCPGQSSLCSTD